MSHTEPVPSVREELERKTVELLETLVQRRDAGRLDDADLSMVAHALWNVTSGLVSSSVSDLCSQVTTVAKPRRMTRYFVGRGSVMSVVWLPDAPGYVIATRNATTLEKTLKAVKTEIGLREEEMKTLFGALARAGYVEI